MKEPISRYFQMGTLTWMSFPSLSTLEAVKRVAADEYFTAVEVRSCRDDAEREEVRRVLEQAHLTVYYGAHPALPKVKETTYKLTLTLLPIQKINDLLEVLLWIRT